MKTRRSTASASTNWECFGTLAKTFVAAALTLAATGAQAQLAVNNSSGVVATSGLTGIPAQAGNFGILSATSAGTVSFTYLGSEAGFLNAFFSVNSGSFLNQNAIYSGMQPSKVGDTFSSAVNAGQLNFSFSTLRPLAYSSTVSNGDSFSTTSVSSFVISSGGVINGKSYDYLLRYDDSYAQGRDFNDLVIGVNFTAAVPEPKDYALLITGLTAMTFSLRRRQKLQLASNQNPAR
jgi:hypothetical protein